MTLSHFAWAVLDQLKQSAVWDGDLVSKCGRSELIANGLAERAPRGMNRLTLNGRALAVRLVSENRRRACQ